MARAHILSLSAPWNNGYSYKMPQYRTQLAANDRITTRGTLLITAMNILATFRQTFDLMTTPTTTMANRIPTIRSGPRTAHDRTKLCDLIMHRITMAVSQETFGGIRVLLHKTGPGHDLSPRSTAIGSDPIHPSAKHQTPTVPALFLVAKAIITDQEDRILA